MSKVIITILTFSIFILFSACAINEEEPNKFGFSDKNTVKWTINFLKEKYLWPENVPSDSNNYNNISELISALNDPFSYYVSDTNKYYNETLGGSYKTAGFYGRFYNGYIKVVAVMPNSPAELSGMKVDDKIIDLVGDDTKYDLSLPSDVAPGYIIGGYLSKSKYTATIDRIGNKLTLEFSSENMAIDSVFSAVNSTDSVMQLLVTGFKYTSSSPQGTYKEIYDKLSNHIDYQNIIIDLRGNGGGSLNQCMNIADLFISNGTLATSKGRDSSDNYTYTANSGGIGESKKVVIWVNRNSASASELLTAAIKQNSNTLVIGETTYGKWVGQTLRDFYNYSAMYYVCMQMFSPNGSSYHKVGFPVDEEIDPADNDALYTRSKQFFENGTKSNIKSPNPKSLTPVRDILLYPQI